MRFGLLYIATFIKQWGLTSATGFMWALVPEVIAYGELKSGKRNAAIINAIMGLFSKSALPSAARFPCGYWPFMALMKPAPSKRQRYRRDHYDRGVDPYRVSHRIDDHHAGLSHLDKT